MKGLIAKQAEYVYNKYKNESLIGPKHVYECESNDEQRPIQY